VSRPSFVLPVPIPRDILRSSSLKFVKKSKKEDLSLTNGGEGDIIEPLLKIAFKEALMAKTISPYHYKDGLKDGIPIGLGYLSVSFGLGITALSMGIKAFEALLISMTNMTSAGEVAGFIIIAASGGIIEMILTQFVINLRYALMGISLTQRLDSQCTTRHRLLMSFGMTDEIFALAASKPYSVGPSYFYGLMTCPYLGWSLGTLLGAVAGSCFQTICNWRWGL
jgi:predicted branched-subunit amino acid permease